MANYLSKPIDYGKPLDTVNEELINQVMAAKQAKFDETSAELDAMVSKIGEIAQYLESDKDKQYLVNRYSAIAEKAIQTGKGLDISKEENARFLQSSISSIVDENVKKAIGNATTIKTVNKEIEEIKKKQPLQYSTINHSYVQKKINAYREDGNEEAIDGLMYEPYVDVNKNFIESIKNRASINGKSYTEVMLPDGSKRTTEVSGMTPEELRIFISQTLTPQERRQLQIEGEVLFGNKENMSIFYDKNKEEWLNRELDRNTDIIIYEQGMIDAGKYDAATAEKAKATIKALEKANEGLNKTYSEFDEAVKDDKQWVNVAGFVMQQKFMEGFSSAWGDTQAIKYEEFLYKEYQEAIKAEKTATFTATEKDLQGKRADALNYFGAVADSNALPQSGEKGTESNLDYYKSNIKATEDIVESIVGSVKETVGETRFNSTYSEEYDKARLTLGDKVAVKDIELEAQKNTLVKLGKIAEAEEFGIKTGQIRQYQALVLEAFNNHEKSIKWDEVGKGIIGRENVKGVFKTTTGEYATMSYDTVISDAIFRVTGQRKETVTVADFKEVMTNPKYSGYSKVVRTAIEVNDYLNDMNRIQSTDSKRERVSEFIRKYNKYNNTNIKEVNAVNIIVGSTLVDTPGGRVNTDTPQFSVQYKDKTLSTLIEKALIGRTYSTPLKDYGIVQNNATKNLLDEDVIFTAVNDYLDPYSKQLRAQNQLTVYAKKDDTNTKGIDETRFHNKAMQKLLAADVNAKVNKDAPIMIQYIPKDSKFILYQMAKGKDGKPKPITAEIPEDELYNDPDLIVGLRSYQNMEMNAMKVVVPIEKRITYNKKDSETLYNYEKYYINKFNGDEYLATQKLMLLSPSRMESYLEPSYDKVGNQIGFGMSQQYVNKYDDKDKGLEVDNKKEIVKRALQNHNQFIVELKPQAGTDKYRKVISILDKNNKKVEITAYQPDVETDRQGILGDIHNSPEIFLSEMLKYTVDYVNMDTENILKTLNEYLPAYNKDLKN